MVYPLRVNASVACCLERVIMVVFLMEVECGIRVVRIFGVFYGDCVDFEVDLWEGLSRVS